MRALLAVVCLLEVGCATEAGIVAAPADAEVVDTTTIDSASVADAADTTAPLETMETSPPDAASGLVEALVTCAPKGDKCAAKGDTRTFVGFRKDFFLPASKYSEPNPDPVDGGRFQIVGTAKVSGPVTSVTIDGVSADTMFVEPKLEWLHVFPSTLRAGEPVWVSFHSRDPKWSAPTLSVMTALGEALTTTVAAKTSPVRLTYVTTDGDTLLVHVRNESDAPRAVTRLLVNGRDVTDAACIAEPSVPARSSVLFTVPLCAAPKVGDAWTVVVETEGATAVGAGRYLRPFFPIETWANPAVGRRISAANSPSAAAARCRTGRWPRRPSTSRSPSRAIFASSRCSRSSTRPSRW